MTTPQQASAPNDDLLCKLTEANKGGVLPLFDDEAFRRAIIDRIIEDEQMDATPTPKGNVEEWIADDEIVRSSSNSKIIRILTEAIDASNARFQEQYELAEQALIAKLINVLVILLAAYVAVAILAIISFVSNSTIIPELGVLSEIIAFAVVIRIMILAFTFLKIRNIRLKKQAAALDAQETIMKGLKKSAEKYRVGPHGVMIVNPTGPVTGQQIIQIQQGAAEADVIALLLAYTKDNHEAHRQAITIATELEKSTPDRSLIYSAWSSIIALLPSVKNVVDIAVGMTKLLGL